MVNGTFKTPANAAIAVGVLAAIPILVIGPRGGSAISIAATGLIYLSYLLTNIGVLAARFRGWPHKPAWFNLGQLGQARQHPRDRLRRPDAASTSRSGTTRTCSGTSAATGGRSRTRSIDTFIKPFGNEISGHAGMADLRDARRRRSLIVGAIYYAVSVRGRAADVESADAATGEAW